MPSGASRPLFCRLPSGVCCTSCRKGRRTGPHRVPPPGGIWPKLPAALLEASSSVGSRLFSPTFPLSSAHPSQSLAVPCPLPPFKCGYSPKALSWPCSHSWRQGFLAGGSGGLGCCWDLRVSNDPEHRSGLSCLNLALRFLPLVSAGSARTAADPGRPFLRPKSSHCWVAGWLSLRDLTLTQNFHPGLPHLCCLEDNVRIC